MSPGRKGRWWVGADQRALRGWRGWRERGRRSRRPQRGPQGPRSQEGRAGRAGARSGGLRGREEGSGRNICQRECAEPPITRKPSGAAPSTGGFFELYQKTRGCCVGNSHHINQWTLSTVADTQKRSIHEDPSSLVISLILSWSEELLSLRTSKRSTASGSRA